MEATIAFAIAARAKKGRKARVTFSFVLLIEESPQSIDIAS